MYRNRRGVGVLERKGRVLMRWKVKHYVRREGKLERESEMEGHSYEGGYASRNGKLGKD